MTSTSDQSLSRPELRLEEVYRAEWGRLLSLLASRTRRLDLVEDALGEAFARAAERWPIDGAPNNPAGWLWTVAHREVLDRLRAEATAGRKAALLVVRPQEMSTADPGEPMADDRLHLILLCCHPALPRESRSALALRLVLGTPTEQIARLFLVSTPTMAARLTRAKRKIVLAGVPLGSPVGDELRSRLDEVCRTVYLAFTAAYAPHSGPELLLVDRAGDGVQLATVLHHLAPEAVQVRALLALVLLQHSRRDARLQDRRLVTLAEQDRGLWHRDEILTAYALLAGLGPGGGYGEELRLQALIAAEHARAPNAAATDWHTIAGVYDVLEALTGSPVVRLNRAVAVGEARGPRAGLALLEGLEDLLPGSHRLAAVRGELAHRAGERACALASLAAAIELCGNDAERAHLRSRLMEIQARGR